MPHHYYDEKKKKKNGNGLSFKDALEASQTPAGKELTKPKPKKSAKKSNGGGKSTSDKLSAAADITAKLGEYLGNHHKYKNVTSWSTGEVKDNEKQPGMDVTQFHNAYGSRNADNTGDDFGKMSDEDRKKKYGF
tara:strand:+ start:134 stop:535 length:402 start_codon:yes stop_codon:yes gene_type:complete